jgi:geranylgeranyl diphosphate synthase, type I
MALKPKPPRGKKPAGRRPKQPSAKRLPPNPFSALLGVVKRDVDTRLRGFLETRVDTAERHGPEVGAMVSAVRDLCLRGGKRFRPALVVTGFRAADARADFEPALDAGVALELLQAYLLIHDDWMDGDLTRRGGPAVHAYLAERFRSRKKGYASGILAGDYAAALALEALSQVEMRRNCAPRIMACFAEMQLDAIAGQQLDLVGSDYDIELAYRLKTGSYTVRGPLRLGAILAGASARTLSALDRFSMPVGVAFQLRDDLLNAFGDPEATGKPFGSDIRSGKRTVLLVQALKRASARERVVLTRVAGNVRASEADVRRALGVIDASGARAHVEARIDEFVQTALNELQKAVTSEGVALLRGATEALTARRS